MPRTPLPQPFQTFIEGAHRFTSRRARDLGDQALASLRQYAPDAHALSRILGEESSGQYDYMLARLRSEPVADFRIDFEDGYGIRPDEDEDEHAQAAARAAAESAREGLLPPSIGIRVKPFTTALRRRSERTTELFLRTLCDAAGGMPARVVVNLAKVTSPEQVRGMAEDLASLEHLLGLEENSIGLEVMLEHPRAFMDDTGRSPLPALREAAEARLRCACLGPYDLTTSLGIAPHEQALGHPSCDFARQQMLFAFAGTGVWLADGSTSLLPVGDAAHVHAAWAAHYDDVRASLVQGFTEGWDVHPLQLVTRWAAVWAFYRSGFDAAAPRLRNLLEQFGESTHLGAVFDDPATGEALLRFVRRAAEAGVASPEELDSFPFPWRVLAVTDFLTLSRGAEERRVRNATS